MPKIRFNKIFLKNFISVGNAGIDFDYKSGLHAVTGHIEPSLKRNGVGKSVLISEPLVFALYGRTLRKTNKEDIINTTNGKDCVVRVEFEINKDKIVIERGIKPTYLKVWENDEEIRYDSMKNTQKWIENKININHTCFTNIIVLNINHSQPFLAMDAKSKRDVLEDILSLNVYSRMANEAKVRHLDAKTDLKVFESELKSSRNALNEALESKNNIDRMMKDFEKEKNQKINDLTSQIESENSLLIKLQEKIDSTNLKTKLEEAKTKTEALTKKINEFLSEKKLLVKSLKDEKEALKVLEHTPYCPTCHTPTDNPVVIKFINETKDKIEKYTEQISKIDSNLEKADVLLTKCKNNEDTISEKISEQEQLHIKIDKVISNIEYYEMRLKEEKDRTLNISDIISDERLNSIKKSSEDAEVSFNTSVKKFAYNKILRSILGEEGVRKYVMSKVLPVLNQKVNHYLQLLGSDYSILFDSNLQEKIIARNRETRSYDSFSSGEKKRIDLSVLLSLMDIAKMQNSVDTNILILDEIIDSSMDSEGVENFLEFLSTNFKEAYKDKAIYIITHRKEIGEGEFFDSMINLVKRNGFTRIDDIITMK